MERRESDKEKKNGNPWLVAKATLKQPAKKWLCVIGRLSTAPWRNRLDGVVGVTNLQRLVQQPNWVTVASDQLNYAG